MFGLFFVYICFSLDFSLSCGNVYNQGGVLILVNFGYVYIYRFKYFLRNLNFVVMFIYIDLNVF